VYLSEDDDPPKTKNDCGVAVLPAGEHIWQGIRTLFHCNAYEVCAEGPIKAWGDDQAKCLLQNFWKTGVIPGNFVCSDDHDWRLCEARKKGSCLDVAGKKWCCSEDVAGQFVFYEQ